MLVVTHLPVVQALVTYFTGRLYTQPIEQGQCLPVQLEVAGWQEVVAGSGQLF